MKKLFLATLINAAFIPVFAHEGHGNESPFGPGHYLVNPQHYPLLIITIIAVAAFAWALIKKTRSIKQK